MLSGPRQRAQKDRMHVDGGWACQGRREEAEPMAPVIQRVVCEAVGQVCRTDWMKDMQALVLETRLPWPCVLHRQFSDETGLLVQSRMAACVNVSPCSTVPLTVDACTRVSEQQALRLTCRLASENGTDLQQTVGQQFVLLTFGQPPISHATRHPPSGRAARSFPKIVILTILGSRFANKPRTSRRKWRCISPPHASARPRTAFWDRN